MICPSCKAANPDGAASCAVCRAVLTGLGPGRVLDGRYELRECLGRGGMGVVYRAHDRALDEEIALKVLQLFAGEEEELRARFRSEIKLARRVSHPNVCRILEYGEDGPHRFITMAFVDGVTVRALLQSGPLAPADAYAIGIGAAEGLQAIHDAGIVHRDLKTPNIMRDRRGHVRILDFGIAKQLDATQHITVKGVLMGTPEYMSPERTRGEPLDARSDLYALGIVIYEMFTGQPPFHGPNSAAILAMHARDPVPLDDPRLPAALLPVLRRALAKHPELRHGSASEMAAALRAARDTPTVATRPMVDVPLPTIPEMPALPAPTVADRVAATAPAPGLRWLPWAIAIGVVGLLLAGVAVLALLWVLGAPEPPAPTTVAAPTTTAPPRGWQPLPEKPVDEPLVSASRPYRTPSASPAARR